MINVFCSVSKNELDEVNGLLLPSLNRLKGVDSIALTIINYSGEGKVYHGESRIGKVVINEISEKKRLGYGAAHNFAFNEVKPENYFLITNPLYLHENAVEHLLQEFNEDVAMVEARQLPFSHPKEYDPQTGETPWAAGACVLVNSKFYRKVGGHDENYFMYNEDVDLSWRAWLAGYKVIYEPKAVAYHFSGAYFKYREDRYHLEHLWSLRNFIYILYKFWGVSGEKKAIAMLNKSRLPQELTQAALVKYRLMKQGLDMKSGLLNEVAIPSQIKVLGVNKFHDLDISQDE